MIKIIGISGILLTMAVSANAEAVIVDFTVAGATDTAVGISSNVLNDVDFGSGRTADVTLTAVNAFDFIAVGVGVAGGDESNRIGANANETLTITFSDFQGGLTAGDISFVGLVASTLATSGSFTFESGDILNVNGVTLTGGDAGDGAAPSLKYTHGGTESYVFQRANSSVRLNSSDALVLDLTTNDGGGYRLQGLELTVESGTVVTGDAISIDFGANAPATANWNQFARTASSTTVSNLVRRSDGAATQVGITVSGITGNGLNHLQGSGSADSSIYFDHIYAQNESPDDTLTVTISGLDNAQTYDLSGGFRRDSTSFEHVWTVGADVRTNSLNGSVVDGYEAFTGLSPSGGVISFTISDSNTADDWASIAELTITASDSFAVAPPVAYAQSVRTKPDTAVNITLSGSQSGLSYVVTSDPEHGLLSETAPNLVYTPTSGYKGSDSFTFTVSNTEGTSAPATVSITVEEKGPNFIIFLTDDLGYNDLGVQGSPHILTPRIDAMAAQGIRFTSGYVPSPVCGPCRAGLLTGSYPIRVAEPSNAKNYHTELHANEICIPELLKTVGYKSALIGKWHNSGAASNATNFAAGRGPIDQGFDYFYGTPSHNGVNAVDTGRNVVTSILRANASGVTVADADLNQSEADGMIYNYTEEAKAFISASHAADEPFFLMLSHNMPHVSLATRQSFRDSAAARGLDVYAATVEELDWSMGQILDKLDELEIDEDTIVIFSSDNGPWTQANLEGYYGSAFPLRGSKMRSLEGGPRVPYIVRRPGTVTSGMVSDEIVTLMDLFPTFMDYAGVSIPNGLGIDGKSIRPLIEGTTTASPHNYYYYYCYTQLAAIRDTRWKLVLPRRNNPDTNWMAFWRSWQDRVDEVQLYDLDNDPEEAFDLASQYPEVVKRLLDQVEVARAELGDKDRIGSGARFFDSGTQRPDIAAYNNSTTTKPYVDEPLTGTPSHTKATTDSAVVRYDDPNAYSSIELVWAFEDQGHQAASVWQAADGGGSAGLGGKSAGVPISYTLTGLNPFRQYIYRFILTDANGTFWSVAAPIDPERDGQIAFEIGIDFSDGGSTSGSGAEPGWNVIHGDGTTSTVLDILGGNALPGVSIQTTGITGGEMSSTDVGFGQANYGNYNYTPFSDLSANDGVSTTGAGTIQVVLSGLDDKHVYDVQVISMPEASTALTDLTIAAGGLTTVRTYESFRPYINYDPAPFTNSDWVLSSPFYSRPTLVPAIFEGLSTNGSGSLTITLSDNQAVPVNAIHVTARMAQGMVDFDGGNQARFWLSPVPTGQAYHVWSSTDLSLWSPLIPALQLDSTTSQPLIVPFDFNEPRMFYRLQE